MFSRFKGLMTLFAILCVAAIAGGSAYFYFGDKASDEKSISNKTEGADNTGGVIADNILENYEFGNDKDLNETYTYYFFPSTLYMRDDFFYSGIMPETVFGYNEVILDDNGDPVLDSDGQPQYKIVTDNIVGKDGCTTYYDYLVNVLNKQSSSYLYDDSLAEKEYPITTRELDHDGSIRGGYTYYYGHEYFYDPYVINNVHIESYMAGEKSYSSSEYYPDQKVSSSNGYYKYRFYNYKNTTEQDFELEFSWGRPTNINDILNSLTYTGEMSKDTEILSPTSNSDDKYGLDLQLDADLVNRFISFENNRYSLSAETMGNKAQYRNDRFGFWTSFYDWDDKNNTEYVANSASRYLPIKITVNGNLTPDDMAKVIPNLSASMFDDHWYFDFSANVRTYVPYENNSYLFNSKEYTTGTGGFTAKDITNIFDIMQNPSKYADKDGNIRLFPVFSNGKNAGGEKANGGSDAIQASFEYNDGFKPTINNDINPKSTKMTYSSVVYNFYNYEVNYAVLKNVQITEDKFTSLKIRMDTTDSPHNWTGKWTDIYSFNSTQLNDLISDYGEGLYTFYLFVGGRATNTNMGSTPFNGDDLVSRITDYSGSGNELYKKYLLPLSDSSNTDIVVNGASSNRYVYNTQDDIGEQARPVALAVEKVTNLRLVSDIPIAEDENGEPKDEQNWTAIDNSIKQGLLNAKNFTIADEVYSIKEDIYNSDTINLPNDGTRIDSNNPYIYVIQNADFRFVNNLYFQIRFSNDYINNAMNVTTDYSRIKGKKPDKYVAYSINNQVLKFKFQDSDDGDVFIENATAGSGTDVRQGFKLKDYNARGIYDILLISHETAGYIGTWTGIVGSDNIELVINDDGTLLYNDEPYTYTVDENTITAVDESESCQVTIIYNETTKSLNVTWKDLYNSYYGKLTDFVYKQQYYMYVNRHTNSFIKLFKGNPGTFENKAEGTNQATNTFVSHKLPSEVSKEEAKDPAKDPTRNENSSLIWNGQTYLGEYLSTSTTGLSYGAKVNGEETPFSKNESFIDAIKRTIGVTPGLDNIYPIYDCVTGQQIAYYNSGVGRLFTSFGSSDGVSSDLDLFTIMKNYVLYIGEPISRVI